MARILDEFDRLHVEELSHSRGSLWAGPSEKSCHPLGASRSHLPPELAPKDWTAGLYAALLKWQEEVGEKQREYVRLDALEAQVRLLKEEVRSLKEKVCACRSVAASIATFAPEPFDVVKPIPVVIEESDDEYIASFYDGNVNAGGCNQQEAVENLKDLLLSRLEHLGKVPPQNLGPALRKQLAVLREFIQRRP